MKNPKLAAAIARYGTSKKLADAASIHRNSLSLYLNGKVTPRTGTVLRICAVLNATPKAIGLLEVSR